MRTTVKMALAAAVATALFAATGPAGALPLHQPPKATRANDVQVPARYYGRPGGVYFGFGFGSPYFAPYYSYPYSGPYYGPGRYRPYSAPGYYQPYYAPRYSRPYYAPRYSQPYYAPRYSAPAPYAYEQNPYPEPAPYSYEARPNESDPTGRCSSGQHYRYPVGCVPN
jgi:hypothetical protein